MLRIRIIILNSSYCVIQEEKVNEVQNGQQMCPNVERFIVQCKSGLQTESRTYTALARKQHIIVYVLMFNL